MNWYLKCLKNYADFSSRARRMEYWMFCGFNLIIYVVLAFIDLTLGWWSHELGFGGLGGIYCLAVIIPGLAVSVRRLHDIGKSGWNYFFVFIPIVGPFILLFRFCKEGEHRSNSWGSDPKMGEE